MKQVRVIATALCAAAGLVAVVATTTAASVAVTPEAGRSIAVITVSCLVPGIVFGTLAVWASAAKAGS